HGGRHRAAADRQRLREPQADGQPLPRRPGLHRARGADREAVRGPHAHDWPRRRARRSTVQGLGGAHRQRAGAAPGHRRRAGHGRSQDLGGQADRGRRAVRLYLEDRRDRGAPAARAPRRAADGRLTLRPDEARGLGLPARARQPQHRPRAADTRRAHGRDPGRSRLHAGGDRAVAPRRDYLSAGAAPIRASLAPTRAPAVASRSAKRASAGWRRAAVRQTRVTGSAGTRAGALTTRSAGASASARAGTNPMPSPPDTYESSSETLGTSMVDTGRTRASARYCSSTARPRLAAARRKIGSRRSRSVSGARSFRLRRGPTQAKGWSKRCRSSRPRGVSWPVTTARSTSPLATSRTPSRECVVTISKRTGGSASSKSRKTGASSPLPRESLAATLSVLAGWP